jgi:transcriptional regulator with XRE-family HTH domain
MQTNNTFGEKIRQLRESRGLLLRQVAAALDIDTALLSKIERGDRKPKREQVIKLAALYEVPRKDLLVLWLSEKVNALLADEPFALEALTISTKKFHSK